MDNFFIDNLPAVIVRFILYNIILFLKAHFEVLSSLIDRGCKLANALLKFSALAV